MLIQKSSTLRRAAIIFAGAIITIGLLNGQAPQPDQNGAYKVGGGVSAPRVKSRSDPEYTVQAKDAKVEGTVVLSVVVGTDGLAHYINVVKGIGNGLDEKAVEAVQKWSFEPGVKDGQPVDVRASIEINFKLM
jgi:periplasmic protein TonB